MSDLQGDALSAAMSPEAEEDLVRQVVVLFTDPVYAEAFAASLLVHYRLSGEWPRTDLRNPEPLLHSDHLREQLTPDDFEDEGMEIEAIPLTRVKEWNERYETPFMLLEFPMPKGGGPPDRYFLQMLVFEGQHPGQESTARWRARLLDDWKSL